MPLVAAPLGSPHGCWIVSCPSISEWSEKDAAYCDWRQHQQLPRPDMRWARARPAGARPAALRSRRNSWDIQRSNEHNTCGRSSWCAVRLSRRNGPGNGRNPTVPRWTPGIQQCVHPEGDVSHAACQIFKPQQCGRALGFVILGQSSAPQRDGANSVKTVRDMKMRAALPAALLLALLGGEPRSAAEVRKAAARQGMPHVAAHQAR